jgi:arginyl-tRNA--protein-N-Asp/Glu arginylyltransferase
LTRELRFPTLYQTAPHPCPYINENTAVNLIIDPSFEVEYGMYERLLEHGFRRNGGLFYRPFCNNCSQCRSVRLSVEEFKPNRAQRRTLKRNQDLTVRCTETRFNEEYFELYQRYQSGRHPGDSMDDDDPEKFKRFLVDSSMPGFSIEFRHNQQLISVAIVDRVNNGLSAVYTFFDPEVKHRSLGTMAILTQIDIAQKLKLKWNYLGYWISQSRKMSYKINFQPLQQFDTQASRWIDLPKDSEKGLNVSG